MSILTANLKHLYQRRGLWLVYAFLGFFVFMSVLVPLDHPGVGKGQYIGLVVLAFLIGLLAAVLPIEVLTKPFSYCLPHHRKVPRRFIFSVGVMVNLFGSLLFFMYPDLHSGQLFLVVCSAFFAGMIFFWLGVGFAFIVRNSGAFIGFFLLVIFGGGFFGLHKVFESVIVGIPFGVILVGIVSSVVAWIWLGVERWARRYCAVPWVGFFDAWNRDKVQRYMKVRAAVKCDKLKQHPRLWVETFFLSRMNRYDYFSVNRYIWGALYKTFGIALSTWKAAFSSVFPILFAICFMGYMGFEQINLLFILPGVMISLMRLPVYSSMLISGGRYERYYCSMVLVVIVSLLVTVMTTIVALFSQALSTVLPNITLRGRTFIFQAMDIQLFFIPLLMMPLIFTLQLVFYRKPLYMMILFMLHMLLFLPLLLLHEHLSPGIIQMIIIGGLILCWSIFLLVSHYICMRRCLVGQR